MAAGLLLLAAPAAAQEPKLNGATFLVSNQLITETSSTNTAAPAQTFRVQDPLTVRVFFKESMKKAMQLTPEDFDVHVWQEFSCPNMPGERATNAYHRTKVWIPKADFDKSYLDLELVPDPKTAHTKYDDGNSRSLVGWSGYESSAKCAKAAQSVTVTVFRSNHSLEIKLPAIKIDYSAADIGKMKQLNEDVVSAGNGAFAKHLALPTAGMRNPGLEGQLAALWKKNLGDITTARTIIESSEWNVDLDPLTGAPNYRAIDVTMLSKRKDGKCFMESVGVNEQAKSRTSFGGPSFAATGGSARQVDCGKAFGGKKKK